MQSIIHERIVRLRERAGLSQHELQAETGISQAALAGIEGGTRTARLDEVLLIAATVGCDPSAILDDYPLEERVLVVHRGRAQLGDTSSARSRMLGFLELDEYLERQGIPG